MPLSVNSLRAVYQVGASIVIAHRQPVFASCVRRFIKRSNLGTRVFSFDDDGICVPDLVVSQ
jgi:hypothetical protein